MDSVSKKSPRIREDIVRVSKDLFSCISAPSLQIIEFPGDVSDGLCVGFVALAVLQRLIGGAIGFGIRAAASLLAFAMIIRKEKA